MRSAVIRTQTCSNAASILVLAVFVSRPLFSPASVAFSPSAAHFPAAHTFVNTGRKPRHSFSLKMAMREGNVEKGLRQDREQLLMGRRFSGGGTGWGGDDAAKVWALLPPDLVSKYSRISELGRGTYGTVILAEDKNASAQPRRVAIKLCRPKDNEMASMLKEGMALQRLNSPMIARLLHMGCTAVNGGLVYTVQELLEGKCVNDIVTDSGPMRIDEACRVGINVLDALRDVHRAGFIHRDIKPHNIMRVQLKDRSWIYKVIDLGSATGALGAERKALPAYVTRGVSNISLGGGGGWGDAGVECAEEEEGERRAWQPNPALRQVFDSMDSDRKGVLSSADVLASLQALGLRVDLATVEQMVRKHDSDANGIIDFYEFGLMYGQLVALPYAAYSSSISNLPILEEAFRALTGEGNSMTFPMLSRCFENQQRQMPPERVRELFGKYDVNGDGNLEFSEFICMFGELVAMQDAINWQGTHGYMSPEQYNDEPVSPASDIWSVGATLFKITCGQTPFTVTGGTWGKGMVGDKSREAPALTSLLFNVPPTFAAIVSKALKKDPSQRFSSASEMREALAQVLDAIGPTQAKPYMEYTAHTLPHTPCSTLPQGGGEGADRQVELGGGQHAATHLYTHGVAWEKPPKTSR